MNHKALRRLIKTHGTPIIVMDHDVLRKNYERFRELMPRVQAYYAVKANSDPAIIQTLYDIGASFDVASISEFRTVHAKIIDLTEDEQQNFIWDRIIYANPIKTAETLLQLDKYKPLVTYDNHEEVMKIAKYAPHSGLLLRLCVPNIGSVVELSSKFGALPSEAVDLISFANYNKLVVEGISFHVGSQCTNIQNYVQALHLTSDIWSVAKSRGIDLKVLDIGGGFPARYDKTIPALRKFASIINAEIDRLFPEPIEVIAEPGRCIVASAATAVSTVIGKAVRSGKPCYYLNDGVYHTYSGIIFDHCHYSIKSFKSGPTMICSVFGPTCDALDTISLAEELPDLDIDDNVYTENIGAYSGASSTHFNGFPPATVIHINS